MNETSLERLLGKAERDEAVLAVFLFGSAARGERTAESDVDVALVMGDPSLDAVEVFRKRLEYMELPGLDVHVFQQLPIYIRHRVLKEGRVLFVRNEDALYELAFRTVQAFEDFRHRYQEYLEEVAVG
jgi:predicted nucleotidyltransferase